ncbi:MAG: hypothetical protein FRX49_00866 [Trebouxia sp. A1-2]|nr:MAG: hypothetical protein FRX49_00866 [Trebouxia sp. A1-2]
MSGDMFVDVRAKPFPADGESGLVRSQFLPGVLGSADSRLPFVGKTSSGGSLPALQADKQGRHLQCTKFLLQPHSSNFLH